MSHKSFLASSVMVSLWVSALMTGGLHAAEIRGVAGKCLDVRGGSAADGTEIILWTCNGRRNQDWEIVDGEIRGLAGKCLDVRDNHSGNGAAVVL